MSASVARSGARARQGLQPLRILMARPRGFCAGVDRALRMLDEALRRFGPPIYARHAIVHNPLVVADFEARGVIFVEEVDDVPDGAIVVLSAHGVARSVASAATDRGLRAIDATCPLVKKVHAEVRHHVAAGRTVLLIGHVGHPEVLGTMGQAEAGQVLLVHDRSSAQTVPIDPTRDYGLVMQTTLSVDEADAIASVLRARGARLVEPAREDICYATTNRQSAVKALARECDAFIVIGGRQSSNSQRLAESAAAAGCPQVMMIERAEELAGDWLDGVHVLGVSAGASTPETSVQALLDRIAATRTIYLEERGEDEDVFFAGSVTFARPPGARQPALPA